MDYDVKTGTKDPGSKTPNIGHVDRVNIMCYCCKNFFNHFYKLLDTTALMGVVTT